MSHHSETPDPNLQSLIDKLNNDTSGDHPDFVGPTGDFPDGQLSPDDNGGIVIGIGCHEGSVVLQFGVPIRWIGFTPEQAREIAQGLIEAADKIVPP